ncbi:ribonuclease H-like domain-containing protein [Chaetomium tenue]|uniref:Ribonuclease H-like domain-containing protein n=1 Tax=Chaetomium tenue TaxID=1854479 RepID=A0ACB7P1E8_9PEZI|nr:ribonuclease H-like domain-containing protein [Chaetomium globosum]
MPAAKKRKMDAAEQKYYAVRAGFKPGVYTSWTICQQQITGFKGAQFKSFLTYEDASAFAAGREPASAMDGTKPPRFYGVAVGRKPGVYTEWPAAQEAIIGWKGPKYKKFETRAEAEAFVRSFSGSAKAIAPTVAGSDQDEADGIEEPTAKRRKTAKKSTKAQNGLVIVYTDGSSLGNGRVGATAGVGVYFGDNDPRNVSERLEGETQTNQRAELTAILRALEIIDLAQDLEIRTDSKYSIQCVTEWYINWERNGWKTRSGPVKNQDLVQLVRDKLEEREAKGGRTQFIWVKGHDTDQGNIAADQLAVAGARL